MRRTFTLLVSLFFTVAMFSQAPEKMSYQAVIRDVSNHLVTTQIGMRISILQGSESGIAKYVETQTPTPNANGLVSIEIGAGSVVSGSFAGIDWFDGPYFIMTETDIDPAGGLTGYNITGTSQLLSVPYALHAKTVASYTETDPIFGAWNKSTGINITASQVSDFQTSVSNNVAVSANTAKNSYPTDDETKLAGIAAGANVGIVPNTSITGATKTKITYDTKGLVTSGADATTADIAASTNKNYVTDAQLTVIGNTSGTNTGDNAVNSLYSGLVTNATHTGDAVGSTALTVVRINGTSLAGLATGILKNTTGTGVPSIAVAGTDYLTPNGSAALLTGFPTLNQNTTGSAASFTGNLVGEVTGTQGATVVGNSAVINKVLTGYLSGAGTVAATDNILQAIQKLNGNNPAHYIGESYGGGIVFYVYDNGKHGLIAATADQSTGVVWTTGTFQSTVSNAVRDGVNGGLANTERIIIQAGVGSYAAHLCANYQGGNYADWYLPSKYELNLLYLQKAVVGGFASYYYWSSTEYNNLYAWRQYFNDGNQAITNKYATVYVRAVRAF